MKISELLERKGRFVATIGPDELVIKAIAELASHNVGALVVSSDGSAVEGIISERDVVRILDRLGVRVLEERVATIMSHAVHTCSPDDPIESLMTMMTEHRIRHVPVVADEKLVGIVSIGDVVKNRLDELEHDRDELINYISAR